MRKMRVPFSQSTTSQNQPSAGPIRLVSIEKTPNNLKPHLPIYSTSRLVAVNQCPTWGVVSAQKRYDTNARAMALEAGSTMHEIFAAVRLWQLEHIQGLSEHAAENAKRIFKAKGRWAKCTRAAGKIGKGFSDQREHLLQLCFEVLHTSEWYDDPSDSVRTMANMELASIHYVDERLPYMGNWPIYVADLSSPDCVVGIEQSFDVVLLYSDGKQVRYIGTIDGLVYHDTGKTQTYYLDENKTASRLDAGWRASFDLSHQVTGYCAACTSVFGFPVFKSRVTGLKIKPTNKGEDVYTLEALTRTESSFQNFASWVRHTVDLFVSNRDDFENAPRYTHSCNRYFRPCALLPFCCDTAEGRKEQWEQMVKAEPSPSERAVMEI